MSSTSKRREGFALAVAMVAIVVIGALIAGAFFTSTQEYRVGRNSLMDQRAFTAAEAGVTQPIQGWLKSLNLSIANGATRAPDTLQVTGGGYAVRRVTRLDDYTFWVMSDGYAGGTSGSIASHHRLNAVYRLAYPNFNILGALTVRGKVEVQGSSKVDGTDAIPPQWTASGICPAASGGMPGVVAPDTTQVCNGNCPEGKNPTPRIFGVPGGESQNAAAADTNTYYKYGDQNWTTLVANADIRLSAGNYKTLPSETGGKCNYGDTNNWGDPARTTECRDYFPIIYINGDLKIQANSRGQGVLLVNGDLEMAGGFEFNGIMIVRDDIKSTGNGNKISGSAFAGNTYTTDNTSISGNSEIQYSQCAIQRAAKGSATIVRTKQRGFAEVLP
ncbi:MAG TPA: hypothetical protein VM076_20315 [Gemmatimonadaceae bacterium]|nr:hypothetical protein [Gemmatimonadaceae bacterium]